MSILKIHFVECTAYG